MARSSWWALTLSAPLHMWVIVFPPHPALASAARSLLSVPSTSGKLQHYRQEVWPPFRISFIYKVPHWETFQSGSPCLMELQSHWLMFYCDITGEKTGNGADSRRRFSSFINIDRDKKKTQGGFFFFCDKMLRAQQSPWRARPEDPMCLLHVHAINKWLILREYDGHQKQTKKKTVTNYKHMI